MDLEQRIGTLSGGQRARVALAKCLLSGAVVVVSHDRFFIDKIAKRLLIFEGTDRLREVNGNWTIWQASLEQEINLDGGAFSYDEQKF